MKQKDQVIERLNSVGYVDNFWSIENRVSLRLAAIIHNLTKDGWKFQVQIGKDKNCFYYVVSRPESGYQIFTPPRASPQLELIRIPMRQDFRNF